MPVLVLEEEGQVAPGANVEPISGQMRIPLYKFYQKPMKNRITILQISAMSDSLKKATFSAEIIRRLKNTSLYIGKEENEVILQDLMDDLTAMGYSAEWREDILISATRGYMRMLSCTEKGLKSRNRKGKETLKARRFKKILGN